MKHPVGTQRWVMWLPMVAVTLPTVCLLWFMTAAVKNERLAVKQKLIEAYGQTLATVQQENQRRWRQATDWTSRDWRPEPAALFKGLVTGPLAAKDSLYAQGAILYDLSGHLLYPVVASASPERGPSDQPRAFQSAWEAEYIAGNFTEAAAQYRLIAFASTAPDVQITASIGAVRCLVKAHQQAQAVELAEEVLSRYGSNRSQDVVVPLFNLRIQMVQVLRDARLPWLAEQATDLLDKAVDYDCPSSALPSQTHAFVLTKAVDLLPPDLAQGALARQVEIARQLGDAEGLSAQVAEQLDPADRPENWPERVIRGLRLTQQVYGFHVTWKDRRVLFLVDKDHLATYLRTLVRQTVPASLGFRVTDDKGMMICEAEARDSPLTAHLLGDFLPGWSLEVFLAGDQFLDAEARHQQMLYIWTGTLVIVLIVVAGGLATQAIGRQIRLNRLKNDFIATVTHELKTPLASMRVLVDTLLEGRTKDDRQVTEYLQLVAKENVRLTGLIDNFLTFSRMERNKQAFDVAPADAATIAYDAIEAVKTHFSLADCRLDAEIAQDLSAIPADHEAMVTVLVNLLDNAFKYSGDDKEIRLRVYAEADAVCFAVSDNGVGIPKRAIRRIFDKFYQVDRTLSRRAGGCGLGLAIVKFIVDAHRGTITVDSRVGQGSTFTVRLPARGRRA